MPAKTARTIVYPDIRTIGFYQNDDERIERIRATILRSDPSRRTISLPEVVRFALAIAADNLDPQ